MGKSKRNESGTRRVNDFERKSQSPSADENIRLDLRTLGQNYESYTSEPSEIVVGLVGPLGTDTPKVRKMISERLRAYGYESDEIQISTMIIPVLAGTEKIPPKTQQYNYRNRLINLGNAIRKKTENNAILAIAAAAEISRRRPNPEKKVTKRAYIISSLKNPQEVEELRKIYGGGFYLFAIHSDRNRRAEKLTESGITLDLAWKLLLRDEDEKYSHGQHTADTFHLADFFVADENNDDKLQNSITRCLDVIFSNPFITPTFNEFAMFMAFASSLRSADLSRQVGAVVTRKSEILTTGENDCPRAGGGLYWPLFIGDRVDDEPRGRDYKRGFDSNAVEKEKLIRKILEHLHPSQRGRIEPILRASPIRDITEYGRVVHAEMEALLACARNNISSVGATIYCTTFPCHNCAKHIIAAGIKEVIYVEPYAKSKAFEFHDDSVTSEKQEADTLVRFKPFIGVGPRQFFDLFSLSLSSGIKVSRKMDDGSGRANVWSEKLATPRIKLFPVAHREFEDAAVSYLKAITKNRKGKREKKG